MNFHYNMNVFLNPCLSFVPYNVQASNCYTALDYAHNYHPSAFSQYFSTANQFNINQF